MMTRLLKWIAAPVVLAAISAVPASAQECDHSRGGYDHGYGGYRDRGAYSDGGYYDREYSDRGYSDRGYYDRDNRVRADIHVSLGRVISQILRQATRDDRSSRYYSREHRRGSDSCRYGRRSHDSRDYRDSYDSDWR